MRNLFISSPTISWRFRMRVALSTRKWRNCKMLQPYDDAASFPLQLQDCSFQELLLLVGDAECGYKTEALEFLLDLDLEKSYSALESAVRDDDNADLRNGAMEVLVK